MAIVNFSPLRIARFKSEILVIGGVQEEGDIILLKPDEPVKRNNPNISFKCKKWKGQTVLSKPGRSRLRQFLYLVTISHVINNPEFKAIHAHNVTVKKIKKMKSIMKIIGKLARMLVGIVRRNEAYCPEKLQSIIPLAA